MKHIYIPIFFILFSFSGYSQGVKQGERLTKANHASLTTESDNVIAKEKMIVVNSTTTFQAKSVDLNTHSIHPDLIISKKQLNKDIKSLKNQLRTSSDRLQIIELKKQLVALKFRKSYLRKNELN